MTPLRSRRTEKLKKPSSQSNFRCFFPCLVLEERKTRRNSAAESAVTQISRGGHSPTSPGRQNKKTLNKKSLLRCAERPRKTFGAETRRKQHRTVSVTLLCPCRWSRPSVGPQAQKTQQKTRPGGTKDRKNSGWEKRNSTTHRDSTRSGRNGHPSTPRGRQNKKPNKKSGMSADWSGRGND